jgi:hypothetical protein
MKIKFKLGELRNGSGKGSFLLSVKERALIILWLTSAANIKLCGAKVVKNEKPYTNT